MNNRFLIIIRSRLHCILLVLRSPKGFHRGRHRQVEMRTANSSLQQAGGGNLRRKLIHCRQWPDTLQAHLLQPKRAPGAKLCCRSMSKYVLVLDVPRAVHQGMCCYTAEHHQASLCHSTAHSSSRGDHSLSLPGMIKPCRQGAAVHQSRRRNPAWRTKCWNSSAARSPEPSVSYRFITRATSSSDNQCCSTD
jgi:hypothetical protein